MEYNQKSLGQKIQLRRAELGIKQADFADMLHISVSSLSKFETGKRAISLDILFSMATQLNCSVDYLLSDGRNVVPYMDFEHLLSDSTLIERELMYDVNLVIKSHLRNHNLEANSCSR